VRGDIEREEMGRGWHPWAGLPVPSWGGFYYLPPFGCRHVMVMMMMAERGS